MSANQVAGGHKANISNPQTSEESKENSKQVISEMESTGELDQGNDDANKNEGNVIGGYKATLKNPNVGEEAKEHAREVLESNGVEV